MRVYVLRSLLFWLPAVVTSVIPTGFTMLHWFCAFFLLFGWTVNTGMAAYRYPLPTLSLLLAYGGSVVLLTVAMYSSSYTTLRHAVTQWLGGLLCYRPLDAFVQSLQRLGNAPWELVALGILLAFCAAGYLAGLLCRYVRTRVAGPYPAP